MTFAPGRQLPPYGPAKGMMEGLQLMTRLSPTRVDERLLRQHRVAPRNEYKVVGALRYLGLIEDDGRPTETSRLLKTRGPVFAQNMQLLARRSYHGVFDRFDVETVTRDDLFNYFVTEEGMGTEMAVKAMRFFIDVCKLAEFDTNPALDVRRGRKPGSRNRTTLEREAADELGLTTPRPRAARPAPTAAASPYTISLQVTPDLLLMDEERLTELLRRLKRSLDRALDTE